MKMDAVAKSISRTPSQPPHPVWVLKIANGAAHTQAAEAIAAAWRETNPQIPAIVIEVSEFMSPLARLTHVTAYLWLVKNAPRLWEKIDNYQKQQTQTSPVWFYRRQCRKLFDLAKKSPPVALVATEVGCGEIAALLKKDLSLEVPCVAINLDYEADRAWVQPEVDFYCVAAEFVKDELIKLGADAAKIGVWGVPLKPAFKALSEYERAQEREKLCREFRLDAALPLVLVAGGGEGLGKIEEIVRQLLKIETQIMVLCGRNMQLKNRLEKLAAQGHKNRLRVLGWTENVASLMQTSDVLVSKLGLSYYEAMACGLPLVALEPPPGAERVQYRMLETGKTGRAVKTPEEMAAAVSELSVSKELTAQMRRNAAKFSRTPSASLKLAAWLNERIGEKSFI